MIEQLLPASHTILDRVQVLSGSRSHLVHLMASSRQACFILCGTATSYTALLVGKLSAAVAGLAAALSMAARSKHRPDRRQLLTAWKHALIRVAATAPVQLAGYSPAVASCGASLHAMAACLMGSVTV